MTTGMRQAARISFSINFESIMTTGRGKATRMLVCINFKWDLHKKWPQAGARQSINFKWNVDQKWPQEDARPPGCHFASISKRKWIRNVDREGQGGQDAILHQFLIRQEGVRPTGCHFALILNKLNKKWRQEGTRQPGCLFALFLIWFE